MVDASRKRSISVEDDSDKTAREALAEEYKDLTEWMKTSLGEQVEISTVSPTPVRLGHLQVGWSANMERIMKRKRWATTARKLQRKKTMEINVLSVIAR